MNEEANTQSQPQPAPIPEPAQELKFVFTLNYAETHQIIQGLAHLPYGTVKALIEKIEQEGNAQLAFARTKEATVANQAEAPGAAQ